jgi:hypothetical protein
MNRSFLSLNNLPWHIEKQFIYQKLKPINYTINSWGVRRRMHINGNKNSVKNVFATQVLGRSDNSWPFTDTEVSLPRSQNSHWILPGSWCAPALHATILSVGWDKEVCTVIRYCPWFESR